MTGAGNGPPWRKRAFDLILTLLGLIVAAPVMAVIALLVIYFHGWPVLFRQQRPGLHGRPFWLYKFRSMSNARDGANRLLPDEQRLTRFGRFLRSTSLDELPELVNVLRGEMSLVGPRPLLMQYLERYSPEQARRHDVLPGVTGWAQINGRNAQTWEDRFRLDLWYVDHWSLKLDLKILLLTVGKVFQRADINPPGQEIMAEFMGSPTAEPPSAAVPEEGFLPHTSTTATPQERKPAHGPAKGPPLDTTHR